MKIEKGTKLKIDHCRKGKFNAVALRDFDSTDDWFPVAVAEDNSDVVRGAANDWVPGEEIPCRGSFCTFEVVA